MTEYDRVDRLIDEAITHMQALARIQVELEKIGELTEEQRIRIVAMLNVGGGLRRRAQRLAERQPDD